MLTKRKAKQSIVRCLRRAYLARTDFLREAWLHLAGHYQTMLPICED